MLEDDYVLKFLGLITFIIKLRLCIKQKLVRLRIRTKVRLGSRLPLKNHSIKVEIKYLPIHPEPIESILCKLRHLLNSLKNTKMYKTMFLVKAPLHSKTIKKRDGRPLNLSVNFSINLQSIR